MNFFTGWRNALLILLGLGLVLSLTLAWGAGTTANVSVTPPTQYTDGSPLPATDIDHYTVTWTGPPSGSMNLTSPTGTIPIACGSVQFMVSVTTTAKALYPNTTSASAGPVPYATGVSCVPKSPGLAVH